MCNPTACTSCAPAGSSAAAAPSSRTNSSAKAMRRRRRDELRPRPRLHRVHVRDLHGPRQSRPRGRRHGAARDADRNRRDCRPHPRLLHRHRQHGQHHRGGLRGGARARCALWPDGAGAAEAARQEAAAPDEEADMTAPFPTHRQEEWRYADLDALKPVWEQFAEPVTLTVSAGEELEEVWLPASDDVQMRRVQLALGEGAKARIFALNTAPVYGRIELEVSLAEGADFELFAANIGTGLSTNEIVTNVRHIGEGARSRQVIRSVLNGKAVGSYLGKVEVARGAQQTDAEQSVKAMLLDRGATANCKPELEIFADDVKCAHGATVGELDAMQLFYAESRGLDPASARALLLEGFVMGLWDSATDPDAIGEAARDALRRVV